MKKGKFLRNASLFGLSAVMLCGVGLSAAGCGGGDNGGNNGGQVGDDGNVVDTYRGGTPGAGGDANTITVKIFCNESDTETNRQVCKQWQDAYNATHGTNITVDLTTQSDKGKYFTDLETAWGNNNVTDVFYLAPRFVRAYAETGRVINIATYLDKASADATLTDPAQISAANAEAFGQIWQNALSYYAYRRGHKDDYTLGQAVSFDEERNGFYTDASNGQDKVGIYGLPKDYSTFVTGFNKNLFSAEIKTAVTHTLPNAVRTVRGPKGEGSQETVSKLTYSAASGSVPTHASTVSSYAVDVDAEHSYDGNAHSAGDPAPIINIGIPTRYYPYNFFRFNSYTTAVAGGDPVALLCDEFTEGQGYVVTIPGFPDETFRIPDDVAKDPDAPYDTSIGHITYTYAEYSALIWAMTYYLNTFAWDEGNAGYGGITSGSEHLVVYGGEQYEGINGAEGSVLYLLPWLYSNDANFIDLSNEVCYSATASGTAIPFDTKQINLDSPEEWRTQAGKYTEPVAKKNLDGSSRNANVQFGFNSENFIETYGAFLALSSDWNGNDFGDTDDSTHGNANGWSYFRAGRSLFYGAGSWDAATRNDTDLSLLDCGQMPTPISEKYALYSKIKGANYEIAEYSNANNAKGVGDAANNDSAQRANLADGLKVYSEDEIIRNQVLRQDKWAARMDTVGYAVNGQVAHYKDDPAQAWKVEACVSLVMALTIGREGQSTLTYAGAQYPNFMDQSIEFFDYQRFGDQGEFADMITPEGDSSVKYYNADGTVNADEAARGKQIWDKYYAVAKQMAADALDDSKKNQTVAEYLNGKDVKWDSNYSNKRLADFVGSTTTTRLAFSMKVLKMVPMTRSDREINVRMQYGLNAVRDSTMYTYNNLWLGDLDARDQNNMFAYRMQKPLGAGYNLLANVVWNPAEDANGRFITPAILCFKAAGTANDKLVQAIGLENNMLNAGN